MPCMLGMSHLSSSSSSPKFAYGEAEERQSRRHRRKVVPLSLTSPVPVLSQNVPGEEVQAWQEGHLGKITSLVKGEEEGWG